ncbi:MAG: hypothetical protein ABI855_15620 [Bacteroidota bacterium]
MNTTILGLITVKTPQQLSALSIQTYIFGAVAGAVFILIAAIVANSIKFEGGANPKDPGKRRMWFWVLLVASFVVFFLYNMFSVAPNVSPNLQSKFMSAYSIGSVITVAVYLILGFILSKTFPTGKLGNWFSSK